ncbi:unnamed protein product [Paramecium primaurelia]|uniref:Uncharacterized protein n=1 Tax=Paramecium primaurelia TaxID=5886 RepID=A0A8S1MAW9_PARPR|nr:unnamed protein product [Paramecium primaurelia]
MIQIQDLLVLTTILFKLYNEQQHRQSQLNYIKLQSSLKLIYISNTRYLQTISFNSLFNFYYKLSIVNLKSKIIRLYHFYQVLLQIKTKHSQQLYQKVQATYQLNNNQQNFIKSEDNKRYY